LGWFLGQLAPELGWQRNGNNANANAIFTLKSSHESRCWDKSGVVRRRFRETSGTPFSNPLRIAVQAAPLRNYYLMDN